MGQGFSEEAVSDEVNPVGGPRKDDIKWEWNFDLMFLERRILDTLFFMEIRVDDDQNGPSFQLLTFDSFVQVM